MDENLANALGILVLIGIAWLVVVAIKNCFHFLASSVRSPVTSSNAFTSHQAWSPPLTVPSSTSYHPDSWWLHFCGHATGPYSTAAILDGLRSGGFSAGMQVCPEGSSQWQPISTWPQFTIPASRVVA